METVIALFNLLNLKYVPLLDIRLEKYLLYPPPPQKKMHVCIILEINIISFFSQFVQQMTHYIKSVSHLQLLRPNTLYKSILWFYQ